MPMSSLDMIRAGIHPANFTGAGPESLNESFLDTFKKLYDLYRKHKSEILKFAQKHKHLSQEEIHDLVREQYGIRESLDERYYLSRHFLKHDDSPRGIFVTMRNFFEKHKIAVSAGLLLLFASSIAYPYMDKADVGKIIQVEEEGEKAFKGKERAKVVGSEEQRCLVEGSRSSI